MGEPKRLQEVVVRPAVGRSLIEGEDLSSINRVLIQIQQTAKAPTATAQPQPKPPERK